jgi:GMP synthase (glutamine-hydrolysing)
VTGRAPSAASTAPVDFLVQGTLYPDVVESGGGTGTANIKSHHNVGGLPDDLQFQLVEPLRTLFKDEVRRSASELGLPPAIVWRQPFPGPGLGIRIIGEVTASGWSAPRGRCHRPRGAHCGRPDRDVWQCPVVLLADVRSVGVQGDGRTYGHPIVLRPVSSEDAMTADWTGCPTTCWPGSPPHHQRGARGQPRGPRRDVEAPRHDRVGVWGTHGVDGSEPRRSGLAHAA